MCIVDIKRQADFTKPIGKSPTRTVRPYMGLRFQLAHLMLSLSQKFLALLAFFPQDPLSRSPAPGIMGCAV